MGVLKTTTSQNILQRVSTNFGIKDNTWHADAIEWIGEAIQGIGYHTGFERKTIEVKVANYRALIPSEIESLHYIYYNGVPLVIAFDRQDLLDKDITSYRNANYHELTELNKEIDRLNALREAISENPTTEATEAFIQSSLKVQTLSSNLHIGDLSDYFNGHWYSIDGGYFKTSFESGTIEVTADVYMIDDDGYPMVVDTFKYREALQWFIMTRMMMQGRTHPVFKYMDCLNQWDTYRLQASNEAKIFDVDKMERFARRWTSIKRNIEIVTLQSDL